ncbi:MAG: bifunctional (p)ppGpp synthetase/guanosine-3',5'-bis(diphosphate) 3'-pyrophosphohydrolase [Planctomycetaceae bacterium]|nr:bifunctional (p)ppGpp synthetase/guanosine-3',5'-bis(diphosphate) 3'-pyrophosphohydrolase [Planctomycetaceae bacterium]
MSEAEIGRQPVGAAYSPLIERALRVAAKHHHSQSRKGGSIPYITHPVATALILQQFGFWEDELLAAALLHDVVEDTPCTLDDLAAEFPPGVVEVVACLSERKRDELGRQRAWSERKREHVEHVRSAPWSARAVVLADKLHNLESIRFDLDAGEDVWRRFNAARDDVDRYYREMIEASCQSDARLVPMAQACLAVLDTLP